MVPNTFLDDRKTRAKTLCCNIRSSHNGDLSATRVFFRRFTSSNSHVPYAFGTRAMKCELYVRNVSKLTGIGGILPGMREGCLFHSTVFLDRARGAFDDPLAMGTPSAQRLVV